MIYESKGTIRYSPKLLGDRPSEKWWLVVDCDDNIGKYYRHLFRMACHSTRSLEVPAWRTHITVIRNEEPPHPQFWEKYSGEVQFTYESEPRTNGDYVWLDVQCPFLLDLRQELGLPRNPFYPLHLSIGHLDLQPQDKVLEWEHVLRSTN